MSAKLNLLQNVACYNSINTLYINFFRRCRRKNIYTYKMSMSSRKEQVSFIQLFRNHVDIQHNETRRF